MRGGLAVWLLIGSLLPIWKQTATAEPQNLWEYLYSMATEQRPHILYEDAVEEARAAYQEVYGS